MHMPSFFQDMNNSRIVIHPALLHAQEISLCPQCLHQGFQVATFLGKQPRGRRVSHDSAAEQSTAQLQPFSHQMGLLSWSETPSTNIQENMVQHLLLSAGSQAHNSRRAPALTVQGLTAAGKPPDSNGALNLKECYSPTRLDKSLTSKGKQDLYGMPAPDCPPNTRPSSKCHSRDQWHVFQSCAPSYLPFLHHKPHMPASTFLVLFLASRIPSRRHHFIPFSPFLFLF